MLTIDASGAAAAAAAAEAASAAAAWSASASADGPASAAASLQATRDPAAAAAHAKTGPSSPPPPPPSPSGNHDLVLAYTALCWTTTCVTAQTKFRLRPAGSGDDEPPLPPPPPPPAPPSMPRDATSFGADTTVRPARRSWFQRMTRKPAPPAPPGAGLLPAPPAFADAGAGASAGVAAAAAAYRAWQTSVLEGLVAFHGLSAGERHLIHEMPSHGMVTLDALQQSLTSTLQANLALPAAERRDGDGGDGGAAAAAAAATAMPGAQEGAVYRLVTTLLVAMLRHRLQTAQGVLVYDARLRHLIRVFSRTVLGAVLAPAVAPLPPLPPPPPLANASSASTLAEGPAAAAERAAPPSAGAPTSSLSAAAAAAAAAASASAIEAAMTPAAIGKLRRLLQHQVEHEAALSLAAEGDVAAHGASVDDTDATAETAARKRPYGKWIGIGVATLSGGLAVGLSAGLAAPLVGAGLGTLFTSLGLTGATAAGIATGVASTGGAAVLGTLFGLGGASLASFKLDRRFRDIREFYFVPLERVEPAALHLIIAVSGWLETMDDVTAPWTTLADHAPYAEIQALAFETAIVMELTQAAGDLLRSSAAYYAGLAIVKTTVMASLVSAVVWPIGLLQLAAVIDNPWTLGMDRAKKAGIILARDVLRVYLQGRRPVTLVGSSLGARTLFYCLLELSTIAASTAAPSSSSSSTAPSPTAGSVHEIVDSVYLLGAPVAEPAKTWALAASVVAGRFVNVYSRHDWFLAFAFRSINASHHPIAGLTPIYLPHETPPAPPPTASASRPTSAASTATTLAGNPSCTPSGTHPGGVAGASASAPSTPRSSSRPFSRLLRRDSAAAAAPSTANVALSPSPSPSPSLAMPRVRSMRAASWHGIRSSAISPTDVEDWTAELDEDRATTAGAPSPRAPASFSASASPAPTPTPTPPPPPAAKREPARVPNPAIGYVIENYDVSHLVKGHGAYRGAVDAILAYVAFEGLAEDVAYVVPGPDPAADDGAADPAAPAAEAETAAPTRVRSAGKTVATPAAILEDDAEAETRVPGGPDAWTGGDAATTTDGETDSDYHDADADGAGIDAVGGVMGGMPPPPMAAVAVHLRARLD